jgi:hypothetical protein
MFSDFKSSLLIGTIIFFVGAFLLLDGLVGGTEANSLLRQSFDIVLLLVPIWAPILFGAMLWRSFTVYTKALNYHQAPKVLLEIKLPPETYKSPLATELMLTTLHTSSGETTIINRNWEGRTRFVHTLEIVSDAGQIRFFIWTREFYKNAVEAAIYGQYPEAEVHVVPDYALPVTYDPDKMLLWGTEYALSNKDAYPIKTYIDYGLDESPKEEFKVDPLAHLLEFMGQCHQGGKIWVQILLQAHKAEKIRFALANPFKTGSIFKHVDWREEAKEIVNDILKRDPETKSSRAKSKEGFPVFPSYTKAETETVAAIERSIAKQAFNVGIRTIYIADKESMNAVNIVGLLGLNGIGPTRFGVYFDWPWQDYKNIRTNRMMKTLLEFYKRRVYFHPPYKQKPMIMTTEEVATLFHFPGTVASVPTLGRLPAKKAQPPVNLPG